MAVGGESRCTCPLHWLWTAAMLSCWYGALHLCCIDVRQWQGMLELLRSPLHSVWQPLCYRATALNADADADAGRPDALLS